MKKIIITVIFLSSFFTLYSVEFIRDIVLDNHLSIIEVEVFNDELYLLTSKYYDNQLKKDILGLVKYYGKNFIELPNEYDDNGIKSKIFLDVSSRISINSKGEIYVTANGLFKLKNNLFEKVSIDEYDENREITNLCFDTYDNLWFTSSIYDKTNNFYKGEIIKITNNEVNKIYESNNFHSFKNGQNRNNTLISLKNGNIAVHKHWQSNIEMDDLLEFDSKDLWIIDQEGNIESSLIKTSAPLPYYKDFGAKTAYHLNKKVATIFEDSKNNIYVTTVNRDLQLEQENVSLNINCCQGVSYLDKNKDWNVFKEEDGLIPYYNQTEWESYNPVYTISELSNGYKFFISLQGFFLIDNSDKIIKLNTKEIFDNSKMIANGEYITNLETFDLKFGRYYDENGSISLVNSGFYKILHTSNGSMYLAHPNGIMLIEEAMLIPQSSINSADVNEIKIFPNPTSDYITLGGIVENTEYDIIDILGNKILSGNYHNNIDISNLKVGHYYLTIPNVSDKALKFIKK